MKTGKSCYRTHKVLNQDQRTMLELLKEKYGHELIQKIKQCRVGKSASLGLVIEELFEEEM